MNNAPAGWYSTDAANPNELRYWDGSTWTEHVHSEVTAARDPRARRRRVNTIVLVVTGVCLAALTLGGVASAVGNRDVSELPADNVAAAESAAAATTTSRVTPSGAPSPSGSSRPSASPSVSASVASPSPTETSLSVAAPASATQGTALTAALALTVKGRAAKTGYSRDQFGNAWVDVDRNGCDTRNDELKLRLTHKQMSGACKVLAGDLDDPYTGKQIHFEYGGASEIDVDHMVALSDAWQKGAAQWEFAKRVAFANDPLNVEPVDASINRKKGDGDAATWLPPNKAWRCDYVARQVAVKSKYGVWVTQAEQDAIVRVLTTCPTQALPGFGTQPVIALNTGGSAPANTPMPKPTTKPTAPLDTVDPDYGTCKEAIAHGAGPYYEGQDEEYAWYRDADKDGIVCER